VCCNFIDKIIIIIWWHIVGITSSRTRRGFFSRRCVTPSGEKTTTVANVFRVEGKGKILCLGVVRDNICISGEILFSD
jgi:hypothetical protein